MEVGKISNDEFSREDAKSNPNTPTPKNMDDSSAMSQQIDSSSSPVSLPKAGTNWPWKTGSCAHWISKAILSSPDMKMPLNEIYAWFIIHVPGIQNKKDQDAKSGWKNTIRHTLTTRKWFCRTTRTDHDGSKNCWTLKNEVLGEPSLRAPSNLTNGVYHNVQSKRMAVFHGNQNDVQSELKMAVSHGNHQYTQSKRAAVSHGNQREMQAQMMAVSLGNQSDVQSEMIAVSHGNQRENQSQMMTVFNGNQRDVQSEMMAFSYNQGNVQSQRIRFRYVSSSTQTSAHLWAHQGHHPQCRYFRGDPDQWS